MKIQVGDIIGLEGEISGFQVIGTSLSFPDVISLSDGRLINISDVFVCRTDNGDGTATETFSDGRIIKVELD